MRLRLLIIISFFSYNILANRFYDAAKEILLDIKDINYNVLSKTSINTLVATAPFYIAARQRDHHIHQHFYHREKHKNINQWPKWSTHVSSGITGVTIASNVIFALFSPNQHLQKTGEMFSIGLPFANIVKNIFKRFKFGCCLRPRNEHFHRYKKTYGGFPSGHMMIMSYATSLYGTQFGPIGWVPFGILSGYVFTNYIVCNRHTASQLVAGITLGTIYGLSSSTVVNSRMAKIAQCLSVSSENNRTCINFNYTF